MCRRLRMVILWTERRTCPDCWQVVGGSEGAAPLSTWGETKKFGDPNLASMVTKDMGMGQRSKPIITYCYNILGNNHPVTSYFSVPSGTRVLIHCTKFMNFEFHWQCC